jgi:hypothetical protein
MPILADYAFNKYSQFGEDGIIQKIFEIIGTESKVCVEFGAWDGFHFANTANLWTQGWYGILIECDPLKFTQLMQNTAAYNCLCFRAKVAAFGANTLEGILAREGVDAQIDLLSIDIDGDDYYILQSITNIRPRLIICEYNPTIPAHMELVPEPGGYFGCSAASLVRLAATKGYSLVALTETNCFFVPQDLVGKFKEFETNLERLAIKKHLTYLMTGYNGNYIASREPTYGLNVPSDEKFSGTYYAFPQVRRPFATFRQMVARIRDKLRV